MRTGRDAEGRIKRWIGERMDRPRDPSGSFVQRPNDDVWTRSPDTGSPMAALWQSTPTSRRRGKPRSLFSRRNTCSRSTCRHTSILRSSAGSRALRLCLNERSSPMFISDIAGSAETTDSLESEELTGLLNCYFVGSAQIRRVGAKVCVSTRLPEGRPLAIPGCSEPAPATTIGPQTPEVCVTNSAFPENLSVSIIVADHRRSEASRSKLALSRHTGDDFRRHQACRKSESADSLRGFGSEPGTDLDFPKLGTE